MHKTDRYLTDKDIEVGTWFMWISSHGHIFRYDNVVLLRQILAVECVVSLEPEFKALTMAYDIAEQDNNCHIYSNNKHVWYRYSDCLYLEPEEAECRVAMLALKTPLHQIKVG